MMTKKNFKRSVGYKSPNAAAAWVLLVLMGVLRQASAAELSVEGDVDQTPSEIRQLSAKAQALDSKIKELEQRIVETQKSVLGNPKEELIDYRLEIKPDVGFYKQSDGSSAIVVSHVRMTMDGRPFLYTQTAQIVSDKFPLPLFLGKISEGQHQVRIQFQTAPLSADVFTSAMTAWRTVDQVLNLDLSIAAGRQQIHSIQVTEKKLQTSETEPSLKKKAADDKPPRTIDKSLEVK